MNATLEDVTRKKQEPTAEELAAEEMVRRAREQGLSLTGPDGLLKQLTKTVLETALNQEVTEHLGHEKHGRPAAGSGNVRNGIRAKTVLTESTGQVGIDVPRDRDGTFEPQIVRKRQRRLAGVDEIVLSLYAKGLTTGEISAHFEEIYGASVSRETVSRITDKVLEEMQSWQVRPLNAVYAAIFVDAIVVKVRDGQVANRPVDWGNDRVQVYDPSGNYIRSFGARGSGVDQLKRPAGITVDGEYVYVADWGNDRVQVFGIDGIIKMALYGDSDLSLRAREWLAENPDMVTRRQQSDSDVEGRFWGPTAVRVDKSGRVFVVDSCRHRIQVYDRGE